MNLDNKFKLLEHVSLTQVEDESVLLDLNSGSYYGLNPIGTQIINAIEKEAKLISHIEAISLTYSMPIEQVRQDAEELLEQLIEQNLVCVDSND